MKSRGGDREQSIESDADLTGLPGSERAYQTLMRAISRGELKSGARLRELDVTARTGLSRTPVRAALARLEEQGLIVNDSARGLIVAELDQSAVCELYAMREVLEGTAARMAARHASDVEISILREIIDRDTALTEAHALAENNRQFHTTLYRSSHNRYLLRMLRSIQEAMLLLGQTTLAVAGRPEASREEHAELLRALERRDAHGAEECARAHIAAALKVRLKLMLLKQDATVLPTVNL
jgi:DNA-binding GntR family transcriptional regulator